MDNFPRLCAAVLERDPNSAIALKYQIGRDALVKAAYIEKENDLNVENQGDKSIDTIDGN